MNEAAGAQRHESLWRGLRHPVVVFDREGVIREANPAFAACFGVPGGRAAGRNLAETLFASDRAKFAEWLSVILRAGDGATPPLEMESQGRHYRADMFTLGESETREESSQLAMILIDITREKAIEQKKADFTSMIVHDLRGPLTAIMGTMELVVSSWGQGVRESYRDLLSGGIQESARMMGLINELLDISKIESGKFSIRPERVNPASILLQAVRSMRNIAEREGIRLDCAIDGQLPNVEADPDKLAQVVINLLSNSIKFTPRGGMVTLFAERPGPLAGRGDVGEVRIAVTDTGQGIPRRDIPQLFTRYAQAENQAAAREKKMEGTGLGLYIVKELVEAHGGRLQMVSEEGLGTSVSFTLPAVTA